MGFYVHRSPGLVFKNCTDFNFDQGYRYWDPMD